MLAVSRRRRRVQRALLFVSVRVLQGGDRPLFAWAVEREVAMGLVHCGLGPFLLFLFLSLPRGLNPLGPGTERWAMFGRGQPMWPEPFLFLFLFPFSFLNLNSNSNLI